MNENLKQLFQKIDELDPPAELAGFIFAKIGKEKIRKAKRQLIFSYFVFGASLVLAIFVGSAFGKAFWQSEFWTMLSLVFSDIAIVMRNWDAFFFSLLETFPAVPAALLLAPIFMLLLSANFCFINKANCKYKYNLVTR